MSNPLQEEAVRAKAQMMFGSSTNKCDLEPLVSLLAVVVLYNRRLSESESVASLARALKGLVTPRCPVSVLIVDNGGIYSVDEVRDTSIMNRWDYFRATTNMGVAGAYAIALERACEDNISHVLLLDQDTDFHVSFLDGACETISKKQGLVPDVILPLVASGSRVISPLHGVVGSVVVAPGVFRGPSIRAVNSGMVVRREFVEALGGFDVRFWLDGLDHWLMSQVRRRKACVEVIEFQLQHNLSVADGHAGVSEDRYRNILRAERILFEEFWSATERVLYPFRLLYRALKAVPSHRERTRELLVQLAWICGRFL